MSDREITELCCQILGRKVNPFRDGDVTLELMERLRLSVGIAPSGCWSAFGLGDPIIHGADIKRIVATLAAEKHKQRN